VTFYSSDNIYEYDSLKLIASYSAGILATILTVIIGCVAFRINGVAHDKSFSAIMTTTRNPDLDIMTAGHSLGPMSEKLDHTKLRFGGIAGRAGGEGVKRAAFGRVGSVSGLRKREKYI
jgi:hypothetical protein